MSSIVGFGYEQVLFDYVVENSCWFPRLQGTYEGGEAGVLEAVEVPGREGFEEMAGFPHDAT